MGQGQSLSILRSIGAFSRSQVTKYGIAPLTHRGYLKKVTDYDDCVQVRGMQFFVYYAEDNHLDIYSNG